MVQLLGLNLLGASDSSPREITQTVSNSETGARVGETGWLIRFFDSQFFCEWIAVSYLYKHDHAGVRDYLCNRMYTLPLPGIESYLFQICYMLVHKPSPSLDKFVIDVCSKSLRIALKVHWFLMAELEDADEDNEGISRIQEKCQIAATLMGEWPPLVRPPAPEALRVSPKSRPVLDRLLSSKQRILSLTSSVSASPPTSSSRSVSVASPSSGNHQLHEDGSGNKVATDETKLFKKLLPGTKVRDAFFFRKSVEREEECNNKEGSSRRSKDKKDEEEELSSSSEGFFKRLLRDSKNDLDDKSGGVAKVEDLEEKEGFFRRLFKDKPVEKKDDKGKIDDEKMGGGCEEEETSEFLSFRKLFRVRPEDARSPLASENGVTGVSPLESSPGTENFFRRLFRDRDKSMEDSELFHSKKLKEKRPGSPMQRNENSNSKPPVASNIMSQIRKGTYHASLDFVQSLCEISYALVDVSPAEDRKKALRESLLEVNSHIAAAQNNGGICFPMGKGIYRVVHLPLDEVVLLNSREKAPYLICIEVLKGEIPSHAKETIDSSKLSRGIPLANGDAQLPRLPPWAYPLSSPHDVHHNNTDSLSKSTSHAIDQAMAHIWEAKIKVVRVNLLVEKQPVNHLDGANVDDEMEWVNVMLTADAGFKMEDIEDQTLHRKEHRRVPSTIAMEKVKAAAAKGEAPVGLPLKGEAGQDPSDAHQKSIGCDMKAGDALSGELWEQKKERIRKDSVYGRLSGWDLRSIIVKSGDDCRQEHLAVQLVSHFYDIFQEAGLPLWLRPYEILVTSSYTALIETIPDTASIHAIKSRFPNISSLRDFFIAKYGENSPSFKLAQRNFVESMAGYSILSYLLQVKDRHNGNLLMDEEGHIIHIDFGFILSNSPGGVNFESAPFKLTRELLEVMDSDADGVPSEFFNYFKVLCIQGFLTCRKHAERIILLVEMLQNSSYPCFKGGPKTIQNLRKRFHLSLTEEQCVTLVLSLISSSLDAWRTRQYDYYQRVLNGIL